MKFKNIIALNCNGENLVQVPDHKKYWCNVETGDIWSTHYGEFKKLNLAKDKDGYFKVSLSQKGKKN